MCVKRRTDARETFKYVQRDVLKCVKRRTDACKSNLMQENFGGEREREREKAT